ncbi:MAG: hypothetical protein HYZ14_13275 [Bacteroidetes bacterium]|nr:hypothetical protein [Bacteroidota bacterium]
MYFNFMLLVGITFLTSSQPAVYADHENGTETEIPFLPTGIYPISATKTDIEKYSEKDQDTYFIVSKPIIALERFASVKIKKAEDGLYGLHVTLDETGKKELSDASTNAVGVKWAFIVNDYLWSVPTVYSPITEGTLVITGGDFSKKSLEAIESQIKKDMEELKNRD